MVQLVLGLAVVFIIVAAATPEDKMRKIIDKIWVKEEVSLIALDIPDSLSSEVSFIGLIKEGKDVLGYGCYATTFGCRVGGCAAPSNPNAQSYETFDYIVVYDADGKVLKVDIAVYGGQYGYEICRKKWLRQFEGKSRFKLEENIDGVTGATISANFLIEDLNRMTTIIKSFQTNSAI